MGDSDSIRILLLEDDAGDAELLNRELRRSGVDCRCERAYNEPGFLAALAAPPDLILADYHLPGYGALDALRALRDRSLEVPVIVVSGTIGEEAAVECLREGATDYLLKDRLARLPQAVRNALEQARLRRAVVDDVTEQMRAEAALRRNQQLLQAIVDGAAAEIYATDLEGRFLLANQRFLERLGVGQAEIIGRRAYEVMAAEAAGLVQARDREALAAGAAVEHEEEVTYRGERRTCLAVRFPLLDPEGRVFALCGIATDVTAVKHLEAQLRQAQKMEAIGQLAGGIAHDFNNLLTVVQGYTQIALERQADGELRRPLEEIARAADRAEDLVRQLLAFSRRQTLAPAAYDLDTVVAGVEGMLGRLLGEDVELAIRLRAASGRVVVVDRGQLEQVIVNLAVNARDAMPEGGILLIETADAELDASYAASRPEASTGPHAMLSVSDTGCGMDAATRARIFEPFFTTKEPGKGTGLGLATVYGIVRQSGGHLEVESEPGGGSTFKIYLPSTPLPAGPAGRRVPAERPPGGTETVLLVEDDPALRELVETWLAAGGYTVVSGATVSGCLDRAGRHQGPIQLLLTDFILPEGRGTEVAVRLARVRPEARVLFMSGYTGDRLSHSGELPAAAWFLAKPFTQAALLAKVRAVLDDAKDGWRPPR